MIRKIELPKIVDKRGNLTFFENYNHIPFEIKRVYWIYDIPGGASRESHANLKSHEIIISISGSFNIVLNDGSNDYNFFLNDPSTGIYIPNLTYRKIENFSTNSVALIASSSNYNPNDYVLDLKKFKKIKNEFRKN
jgi:oxalate decarboxylase/phosphoglucose isomerase-like protein (cupin superfamily)